MSRGAPDGSGPGGVAERIEEWRRTGDLTRLWPHVSEPDLRAAHHRVYLATEAVLGGGDGRTGLRATGRPPGPSGPLGAGDGAEAHALGVAAFASGTGPLLGWWVQEGRLHASSAAREVLDSHLRHGIRRTSMLRNHLARVVRAMHAEDVDPVLLKGLHTGAEYFPRPGTRPAADIDLLVRPEERSRAAAALAAAGLAESRRTSFADRSEWSPVGGPRQVRSLELEHADDPWTVDVHTSLERWYFRGLRRGLGEEAFRRTRRIVVDATADDREGRTPPTANGGADGGRGELEGRRGPGRRADGRAEPGGGGAEPRVERAPEGRDPGELDPGERDPGGRGPGGRRPGGRSPGGRAPGGRTGGLAGPGDRDGGSLPETLSGGGTAVRVLGQPDLTAFLALHASYELVRIRLIRVVELVLVIRRDLERGLLDWSGLEELVEETRTGRFVHPALALAEELVPGTVSPRVLARTGRRVTRRARRVLAAVRDADMAPLTRRSLDAKLMWARGPRQLLLNLSETLLPSDEALEGGLLRLQWRRLAALIRGEAGWRAGTGTDTMDT